MKTIFIISPWYLSQIDEEAEDFSFSIQGYGSLRDANVGITRINSMDLLGVAFVHDGIPSADTKEFSRLRSFLQKVDKMHDSKKVVFLLRDSSHGIRQLVQGLSNIRVFVSAEHAVFTDTLIRQNVFGSILLDNNPVYDIKKQLDEAPDLGDPQSYRLKYEDFIGHSYLDVMEPLRKYSTSGDTIMNDDVYQRYRDTNQLLALLRKKVILNTFNERDQILDSVLTKMINDIDDSEIWCLCNVLQEAVC